MSSLFHFLFKYERLVFEQGRFVFAATRSMWGVAAIAAGAALYALLTYRRLQNVSGAERLRLLAFRVPMFLLVLFALLRPTLLLKVAVPQQNFVGILLDDSRSMQIVDEAGEPRAEFVKNQFGRTDGPLLAALGKRFVVRLFRFSSSAERLQSSGDLGFQGTGTRLGDALDRARDELSGLPVAGLVVVSDGADNSSTTIDQPIAGLKAQAMPVFAVGVGKDQLARDVQITRVETPRRVLKGTALVVDATITATGYAGMKVPLVVEDSGRQVSTQDVTLPNDGESATVHVRFVTSEAGPRVFKFRVPVQEGEEVPQNNQREALIDVFDRREKLLYLEDLRPESKFIRQATNEDNNLQIALLERTAQAAVNAPDKFWRAGLDGPHELELGFPATREELFAYRSIILGSVEASAFSPEQQRMLEDFVDVRGGSLIALGGDASFSEGGWAGTPLAEALPVTLDRAVKGAARYFDQLLVRPTKAGTFHPATQITDKEADAAAKWRDLHAALDRQHHQRRQAGRHGAARRRRREGTHRAGPHVPAVRPRQGRRAHRAGFLALAHAAADHRHDAPHVLAAARALAGGRRAGSRDGLRLAGSRREGRAHHAHGRRRRRRVQGHRQRARHGARRLAVGQDRRRADDVDGEAGRPVHRALHAGGRRRLQGHGWRLVRRDRRRRA